jgi:methionine-rich copper-binding protein CopC
MNRTFLPLVIVATLWSGRGAAHAALEQSTPRADESLRQAPAIVTLYFDSELEPVFSKLTVADEQGAQVSVGDARANRKSLSVRLGAVARGTYHVRWDVVAHDGHRSKGDYVFTVK